MGQNINIKFPFSDSLDGSYVELTKNTKDAIKSNLMHLILTERGERLYMPRFGTNLRKMIFEQLDSLTSDKIKDDLSKTISEYMPKLKIDSILLDRLESELTARVTINYTITDNVFEETDILSIEL